MLKEISPIIRRLFRNRKRSLVTLVATGLLLGVLPTMRSELEAGLIDQISDALRSMTEARPAVAQIFASPLTRFSQTVREDRDLIEVFSGSLFSHLNLATALGTFFLLMLLALLMEYWNTFTRTGITRDAFTALRRRALYASLVTEPSASPPTANTAGQYANAIQQGAVGVTSTFGYVLDAFQYTVSLVTIIWLLSSRSLLFALCCLFLVAAMTIVSVVQARRLERDRNTFDKQRNDVVARTDDILAKKEIILAYEQEERYSGKLDTVAARYAAIDRTLDIRDKKYSLLTDAISDTGKIAILVVALLLGLLVDHRSIATIGDAYFLISIYSRLFATTQNLLSRYGDIKRSEGTCRTFLELLRLPGRQALPRDTSTLAPGSIGIQFANVTFRYSRDDRRPVLTDCTFSIPGGMTTLLVGRSGSGKTTAARLILGFWRPDSGEILVAGRKVTEVSPPELRMHMSYVAQADHIVDDTIRDNLSWAVAPSCPTDEQMLEALLAVGLLPTAAQDSILDERARDLSSGQQQRLSLARMLLDNAPVIIMDEPFSGADIFTIRDILVVLKRALQEKGRTVLIISHQIALSALAQHIVVLGDDGHVIEEGATQDLLAKSTGVFHSLHSTAMAALGQRESPMAQQTPSPLPRAHGGRSDGEG